MPEFEQYAERDGHSTQPAEDRRHVVFIASSRQGGPIHRCSCRSRSLRRQAEPGKYLLFNPSSHLDRCVANLIRGQLVIF